jgi:hypothetical protein
MTKNPVLYELFWIAMNLQLSKRVSIYLDWWRMDTIIKIVMQLYSFPFSIRKAHSFLSIINYLRLILKTSAAHYSTKSSIKSCRTLFTFQVISESIGSMSHMFYSNTFWCFNILLLLTSIPLIHYSFVKL